jgi:hypothetical protein
MTIYYQDRAVTLLNVRRPQDSGIHAGGFGSLRGHHPTSLTDDVYVRVVSDVAKEAGEARAAVVARRPRWDDERGGGWSLGVRTHQKALALDIIVRHAVSVLTSKNRKI